MYFLRALVLLSPSLSIYKNFSQNSNDYCISFYFKKIKLLLAIVGKYFGSNFKTSS